MSRRYPRSRFSFAWRVSDITDHVARDRVRGGLWLCRTSRGRGPVTSQGRPRGTQHAGPPRRAHGAWGGRDVPPPWRRWRDSCALRSAARRDRPTQWRGARPCASQHRPPRCPPRPGVSAAAGDLAWPRARAGHSPRSAGCGGRRGHATARAPPGRSQRTFEPQKDVCVGGRGGPAGRPGRVARPLDVYEHDLAGPHSGDSGEATSVGSWRVPVLRVQVRTLQKF